MPTQREIDANGFMTIRGNPISSYGIFDYSAGQLGLPGDPMRIVKVFRPESAVSDPAAIDSFKDMPFIVEHSMLSGFADETDPELVAPEDKGVDGVLTSNVYYDAPWMRGDIKVFSRKAQKFIRKGMADLSLGYDCKFFLRPGTWGGQAYEVVQTDLRGNHIALVPEGRVPGARILDARVFDGKGNTEGGVKTVIHETIQLGEFDMAGKRARIGDNAVQQLQALIPALQQFLAQEATEPAHQEGAVGGDMGGAPAQPAPSTAGGTGEAAAEETGENNKDAAGAVPAGEGAVPAAAAPEGGDGLPALISEIEAILAKLKAAAGGAGGAADEGEGNAEEAQAQDTVEGLQEGGHNAQLAADAAGAGNESPVGNESGKASAGPSEGINAKAGDASVRALYADLAAKDRIYDGLSQVVGAFNHKAMDARQVAAYGVSKLGLKNVTPGQEIQAIDIYLAGREKAVKDTAEQLRAVTAQDGKGGYQVPNRGTGDAGLDAYLNGSK